MAEYISTHIFRGEVIDCRSVQIEFEFSCATLQQVKKLAEYCANETLTLLDGQFSLCWWWNDRRIKKSALLSAIDKEDVHCSMAFCGNALNSGITTYKEVKAYNRSLEKQLMLSGDSMEYSMDYWDIYRELFSNVTDPNEAAHNLLRLFNMENRYFQQLWFGEDISGGLWTHRYMKNKDLYYGCFELRIAAVCVMSFIETFASAAANFLKWTIEIIPNISGRVTLSPQRQPSACSAHMGYFGGWIQPCPPGREPYMDEGEWTRTYYLRGTEWYNLLSPMQANQVMHKEIPPGIVVEKQKNEGCTVTIKKGLLQTGVSDLCILKEYLYPVLYPGGCEIHLKHLLDIGTRGYLVKPRRIWENIPVLASELHVCGECIKLEYQKLQDT